MSMTELSHTLDVRPAEAPDTDDHAASTLVRGAGRMAKLLISASPSGARGFAMSMQERLGEIEDDDVKQRFWAIVLDMLTAHERPKMPQ